MGNAVVDNGIEAGESQRVPLRRRVVGRHGSASLPCVRRGAVRGGTAIDLDAPASAVTPVEPDPEVAAAAERLSRRYAYRFVKRAFDIAFSLLVLVCLCWLFAAVAVAIKVDDPEGPVLFRQRRVTGGGREFTMYKFRSMCADAEERLAELRALNEKTGPVFKIADDPRVTRVGRLLHTSSLELQKCDRRLGSSLGTHHHYTSFLFLSFTAFGGPKDTSERSLCTRAQVPFAPVGTVA